jgi:hypothetical protein
MAWGYVWNIRRREPAVSVTNHGDDLGKKCIGKGLKIVGTYVKLKCR